MSPNSFTFLRYLNTVFDNIKDSVMLVSVESEDNLHLLLANKRFHDLSGFSKDCIGKNLYDFVDPERHKTMKRHYRQVINLKKPISYVTWSKVPRGRLAFEVDLIPVLNTVDEVVQIIVLARDVTKITVLEEQVRKLKASSSPRPATS